MDKEILQEQADNDIEEEVVEEELIDDNEEETSEIESDSPTETSKDETKAYSERLKKDREKIRNEERRVLQEEQAQSLGYESWEEFVKESTNKKLIDEGLDPDRVTPLLKDLIKKDPEYQEALRYKKEKEEYESKVWAKTQLEQLNSKFNTNFKDVEELDDETIEMWNNGIALEKAFVANNFDKIKDSKLKKSKINDASKKHLKSVSGGGTAGTPIVVTEDEVQAFKSVNPDATKEDIIKFKQKKQGGN